MNKGWGEALARARAALMRRGRSQHDAEDLVQEAWIRLASFERRQTVERPEAFLMRVALNLSIDAHRMQMYRGEQVLLDTEVLVDLAPTQETVLLAREQLDRLSVCLSRLPAKTREILLANRVDELSYQQIAAAHGICVSTVEKHIAKAMLLLTKGMDGW